MISGRARNFASGLTPWSRSLQAASDQSVPRSAKAKKAIGSAQAGLASDRKSGRGSTVKASAISHSASTMLTPLVDHGKRIDQNGQQIDVQKPRVGIVPRGPYDRKPGNAWLFADYGHLIPCARHDSARETSPGRGSTTTSIARWIVPSDSSVVKRIDSRHRLF